MVGRRTDYVKFFRTHVVVRVDKMSGNHGKRNDVANLRRKLGALFEMSLE